LDAWVSGVLGGEAVEQVKEALQPQLLTGIEAYRELRDDNGRLWRFCEGKKVLPKIAQDVGLGPDPLCKRIITSWKRGLVPWPELCTALKDWVTALLTVQANGDVA